MFWKKNHFVRNLRQLIDEKVSVNDSRNTDGSVNLTSYISVYNELSSCLNISVEDLMKISAGKLEVDYWTKLKIAQYFHLPMMILEYTKLWSIGITSPARLGEKSLSKLRLLK